MAQLTIYLSRETEAKVRKAARRAKSSVSAYIAQLVEAPRSEDARQLWPPEFEALFGSWQGDFPSKDSALLPLDEPASWD